MTRVRLTLHEVAMAATAGCQRNILGLARNAPHAYGTPSNAWAIHIEGACAELAVAKAIGAYWEPVWSQIDNSRDDVGTWQVRSTTHENGSLILHEADRDDACFVLVVGSAPRYRIAGWIIGHEGKHPEFWRTDTGRPAFFVPQASLLPFDDFVAVAA